ncbi:hypothetical protein MYX77_11850, partial [Acidobacteriia bacterium AH_259_A11_L15]|nr:hypothetical protein [Acidobacteriia bacterium AH_259_A11_L15]
MIVLTRAKFLLLILFLLALLSGGLLAGIAYRDPIVSWLGGGQTAPKTAAQPAAHDPASSTPGEREVLYWYDPMHPQYSSDQPGLAPDCGMQLVPKYADEVEAMQDRPPGTVMLSPQKQQLIGVRTTQVQRQRLERTIRTVGHLEVDETQIARIHVKIAGWVEQVYVD